MTFHVLSVKVQIDQVLRAALTEPLHTIDANCHAVFDEVKRNVFGSSCPPKFGESVDQVAHRAFLRMTVSNSGMMYAASGKCEMVGIVRDENSAFGGGKFELRLIGSAQ